MNNRVDDKLVVGITMGDLGGIGPEVVVKALADPALRLERDSVRAGSAVRDDPAQRHLRPHGCGVDPEFSRAEFRHVQLLYNGQPFGARDSGLYHHPGCR